MYPLKNKLAMYGLYTFIVVAMVSGGWMIYASQQLKKDMSRVGVTSVSSFSSRSASASASSSIFSRARSSIAPTIINSSISSSASSESSSIFSSKIVAPTTQTITPEPIFVPPASQQPPASSTPPPVVISSQAASVAPPTSTIPISSSSTPPPSVSSTPPLVSSSSSTAPQPITYSVTQPYTSPGGPVTVVFFLTTLSSAITSTATTFQSGDGASQNYVSTFRNGIFSKVSGKTIAELDAVSVSGASLTSVAFNTALTSFKQQAQ